MESLPHVNGVCNPSSDTLHALASTGLFSRLLCGCFGPRGMSSSYPEEDLFSKSGPCSVALSDQDSSIFQSLAEPHLEWEREYDVSPMKDLCSSVVFLDWEIPGDSETADPQVPDIILDAGDLEGPLSPLSLQSGLLSDRLRCFAAGFVIHLVLICLFFSVPTALPKGHGGISDKPVCVIIPVRCEVDTPDIPSGGSADSPASMASLARRHPKSEEAEARRELMKEPATEVEPERVIEKLKDESGPVKAELTEETTTTRKKVRPDISFQDGPQNDSTSSRDSVASAPSLATPKRKGALKAGDETESYKDKILSAIHQAAYFPKAAGKKMVFGKAVVSFTINKDGSLANVSLVDHSESETLNEAALKIVQQASSQFPPIPEELMRDQVTYVVPIVFKRKS
jgi:TonB family protein